MKSIYIFTPGELKRKDNTLIVINEKTKKVIPIESVEDIKVFSEVNVNKSTLHFLNQKGIAVHFFSYFGNFIGSFYPQKSNNNGKTFVNQVKNYIDEEKRIFVARKIVYGELKNIISVINAYRRKLVVKNDFEKYIPFILESKSIEKLMTVEAAFRKLYYSNFDSILSKNNLKFEIRTKQPPKNEINALISFGNTLVYMDMIKNIYKTHLDPRVGYLHSSNERNFTLNLDLSEIFKPIIIDKIIFHSINTKSITKKDFRKENEGIYLNDLGRKKFVTFYENKLKETIYNEKLKRKISYKTLMQNEVYSLEKYLDRKSVV